MAELLGAQLPDVGGWAFSGGNWMWILVVVCFAFAACIIFYVFFMWRIFNKKIVVFENIAGQGYQVTYKDTGRLVKMGDGGEEILYLRKKKVYRTAYGRKMGKNIYWFAVGQDGYWYNCILGDIDAKMGMLDIEPIDRDMRYAHAAIRKNLIDRYRKIGFMDKYGSWVMGGIMMMLLLVGMWILLDKMAETAATTAGATTTALQVQEATREIVASLDNICSGGAGIVPAGT